MKLGGALPAETLPEEIPALIETLLATEQRLEELTGGEVDTVAGRDGRTFLLRRAQEQLRYREAAKQAASQSNMAAAQRLAHLGSWELELTNSKDIDANSLHWSDEMFRIAGYAPGAVEVSTELFFRLVHPDDREPLRQAMETAMRERREYSIVHRLIRPDGQTRVVQETGQIVCDEKTGQPLKIVGTAHDITERKQVEETLRESDEKFRQLAETISDVFYMASPDLQQMLYISPAYEQIWGRSTESLYANPHQWGEAVLPEEREGVMAAFSRLGTGEPRVSAEFRIARPDGTVRWILSRGFPVRDASGKVIRITGIASDITERKSVEEALEKRAAELERFHRLSVGRELQMIELKKDVNELAKLAGRTPPYNLSFLEKEPARPGSALKVADHD